MSRLWGALCEASCCHRVRGGFEKQPVAPWWKEMISVADRMEENDFCISFLHCWALPGTTAVLQPVSCA